jgi:3-hydroxyisobutyrate dehydrogenase-like beta-hydroxyacid dehydrogenase
VDNGGGPPRSAGHMSERKQWLVVGHGSVGSFVAGRLLARGERVAVFDPSPRVLPVLADLVDLPDIHDAVDYAVSCVPPTIAHTVPALLAGAVRSDGLLFDWNSTSPASKRTVESEMAVPTIDVALLDTLDEDRDQPRLAISGPAASRAVPLLVDQGFQISVVGDEVGEAASAKYLRSIFMKSLEALVLEYEALGSVLDRRNVVRESLGASLGEEFVEFMGVLLRTDRVHAHRRADELEDAVRTFREDGWPLTVPTAAVEVLRSAAEAWIAPGAPPAGATAGDLATHLERTLWHSTPST